MTTDAFTKAREAFAALSSSEQMAIRAEFPPIDEGFAKTHGLEKVARRYNDARRFLNVTDARQIAILRALKTQAIELADKSTTPDPIIATPKGDTER